MNCSIIKYSKEHFEDIVIIAMAQYNQERLHVFSKITELTQGDSRMLLPEINLATWKQYLQKELEKSTGYVALEQDKVTGYLLCNHSNENDTTCSYSIPMIGYGSSSKNRVQLLSRLFQQFAQDAFQGKKLQFEVKLYAHDNEIVKLFSMLQFGIQCEQGICDTKTVLDADITEINSTPFSGQQKKVRYLQKGGIVYREMDKQEMELRWCKVWELLRQLIDHLKESPVFYPGNEFTEEVYREFFFDTQTRVFVAEKNQKLLGLIETNTSGNDVITMEEHCYNIGEAYVKPEYRGTQISKELITYASAMVKEQGARQMWVEHGTANPQARGFWGKYFSTYCYSMIREIKAI